MRGIRDRALEELLEELLTHYPATVAYLAACLILEVTAAVHPWSP